jgi:hypothetical protein
MVAIYTALEATTDGGLHKLFGGGFGRRWNEQIMGRHEQGKEVVIGVNEGRGVASGRPRGKGSGVDGFELPVVS